MKRILSIALCAAVALLAVSCIEDIFDPTDPYGEKDNTPAILDGNTLTYGDHNYTIKVKDTEGTVTFTHFPSNVREFKALQTQLLGKTKPGVLALELMAMEMYRRNRTAGEAALELCNVSANTKAVMRELQLKFPAVRGDEESDSNHQPYLIASFLKGSTMQNKYQPDYPYVLTFYENTSPLVSQGEYSLTYFGRTYNWCIKQYGERDTNATIVLIDDEELYLVNNCSDYYSVPFINNWEDTLK